MYKYIFSLLLVCTLLIGCSSQEESAETESEDVTSAEESNEDVNEENPNVNNLIDKQNLNEGSWISSAGTEREDESMIHTNIIDYAPENTYYLTHGAYISYYNNEDFIKTVLHEGENPIEVQTIDDADNIVLSFRVAFIENISLHK